MAGGFMQLFQGKVPFGMSDANPQSNAGTQPVVKQNDPADPANNPLQPKMTKSAESDPNYIPPQEGSSLDKFTTLLQTDPNAKPVEDPFAKPLLEMDPKKLGESISKMQLAAIPQELMAKALAGDANAFQQAMNQVAQSATHASIAATASIVERAIADNNARNEAALPARVRGLQIDQSVPENKVLQHPIAMGFVNMAKQAIAEANPHLSAAEVTRQAEGMMLAMNADMNTADTKQKGAAAAKKEPQWLSLLTSDKAATQ